MRNYLQNSTLFSIAKPNKVYVNSARISLCLKAGWGQEDGVPLSQVNLTFSRRAKFLKLTSIMLCRNNEITNS